MISHEVFKRRIKNIICSSTPVTNETILNDGKDGRIWDSLAAVAFLDLVEDNGGKHYDSTEVLANCKTVKDLWIFYQNNLVEKDAI